MIPWFETPSVPLVFGLSVHAFGALAALGIYVASALAVRAARRQGLDPTPIQRVAPWALGGGILGAHLVHVLGYHPEMLSQEGPLVLFQVWNGVSSMGGILGGLAGVLFFFHRERVPVLPYVDALVLGIAPGWAIARVGCFTAHDHPGVLTNFFLAVQYPGGARHDLGLYDALLLLALTGVLYALARRKPATGVLTGVLALGYGVPRFFLDFLRAQDLPFVDGRILGLTPAQYVCIGLFVVGLRLLWPTLGLRSAAPQNRVRRLAVVGSVLLATVGCDQATKHVAQASLSDGLTHSFGGDVLRVGLAHNGGAFLSLGHSLPSMGRMLLFVVAVGAVLFAVLAWAVISRNLSGTSVVALTLIAGGGLGNWVDRIRNGGTVVDFLNLGVGRLRTGIFNVADVAIIAGAILLLIATRRRATTQAQTQGPPPPSS